MRSKSSSFCVMPIRWMVNESAPRSDTIASVTAAFTPVISATTVMIDDTATMLPSSVSIDRSLLAQIDASASMTDSKSCDIRYLSSLFVISFFVISCRSRLRRDLHQVAFIHAAHRVERAR